MLSIAQYLTLPPDALSVVGNTTHSNGPFINQSGNGYITINLCFFKQNTSIPGILLTNII